MNIVKKFCFMFIFLASIITTSFAQTVIDCINISSPVGASMAVNKITNKVYVFGLKTFGRIKPRRSFSFIAEIDGNTNTITDRIEIAINQETNQIYAGVTEETEEADLFNSFLDIIDAETLETVDTITLGNGGANSIIALNSKTKKIYVGRVIPESADFFANLNFIDVIDLTTNKVIKTIEFDGILAGIVIDEDTNKIYLAEEKGLTSEDFIDAENFVVVIDGTNDEIINSFELPAEDNTDIVVNQKTNRVYVASLVVDELSESEPKPRKSTIFILEDDQIVDTVVLNDGTKGSTSFSLAVNPTTNIIYTSIVGGVLKVVQDE